MKLHLNSRLLLSLICALGASIAITQFSSHADVAQNSNQNQPQQQDTQQTQHQTFTINKPSQMLGASRPSKIANAYDISQYQGYLTNSQVQRLKHEVDFMILRAQGGDYKDTEINHNEALMQRNHIPYGVYSYSYYTSPYNARLEAKELYNRAPKANFYANDMEQNSAGSQLNQATQQWADEIHHLTRKPAVLYSGNWFLNHNLTYRTMKHYNAIWDAAYGAEPSSSVYAVNYMPYHYDLWQYRDNQYSPALNEYIDADVFPDGANKPLKFWTGHIKQIRRTINYHKQHPYTKRKPKRAHSSSEPVYYIDYATEQGIINYGHGLVRKLNNRTGIHRQSANQFQHKLNYLMYQVRTIRRYDEAINKFGRYNRSHVNGILSNLSYDIRQLRHINYLQNKNFGSYYRYNHIHYLKVLHRIWLYNPNNTKYRLVKRGTILHVKYFPDYLLKRGWISRAYGNYGCHNVLFTSNKQAVQWI